MKTNAVCLLAGLFGLSVAACGSTGSSSGTSAPAAGAAATVTGGGGTLAAPAGGAGMNGQNGGIATSAGGTEDGGKMGATAGAGGQSGGMAAGGQPQMPGIYAPAAAPKRPRAPRRRPAKSSSSNRRSTPSFRSPSTGSVNGLPTPTPAASAGKPWPISTAMVISISRPASATRCRAASFGGNNARPIIGSGIKSAPGKPCKRRATRFDVDGDGLMDLLSGDSWFKNPGKSRDMPWSRISAGTPAAEKTHGR